MCPTSIMSVQSISGMTGTGSTWIWLVVIAVVLVYASRQGKRRKSRRRHGGMGGDGWGHALLMTLVIWGAWWMSVFVLGLPFANAQAVLITAAVNVVLLLFVWGLFRSP